MESPEYLPCMEKCQLSELKLIRHQTALGSQCSELQTEMFLWIPSESVTRAGHSILKKQWGKWQILDKSQQTDRRSEQQEDKCTFSAVLKQMGAGDIHSCYALNTKVAQNCPSERPDLWTHPGYLIHNMLLIYFWRKRGKSFPAR